MGLDLVNTLMYGLFMVDKLSKKSWLQHGLDTLASTGFEALKAEPMAKALNVSRGSFYWHFKDIRDFQQAILELWRERATLQVIQATDESNFVQSRLMTLVHRSFDADNNLEAAIRAWAALSKEAAEAAQYVDDERVSYLECLLISEGVSPVKAKPRATFIYWAYLGQSLKIGDNFDCMSGTDLEQIVELFIP